MTTLTRILIIIAAALGIAVGWMARGPVTAAPVREHAAAAVQQADGSTVLERRESTPVPTPPPVVIPAGGKEVRRISLEIQPQRGTIFHGSEAEPFPVTREGIGDADKGRAGLQSQCSMPVGSNPIGVDGSASDSCDCPPVTVDLSLVEMPDKTKRVIAKSSGQILSGYDLPIERPGPAIHVPRWTLSAIAVGDVEGIRPGALLSRRLGPFVVGGGLLSDPGLRRPGAIAQLGITW